MHSIDLTVVNAMDRDTFAQTLGPTFELAPWVAEAAWAQRPFASVGALHAAMMNAVLLATDAQQLVFLCGHPELAGREAQTGTMTAESVDEQGSAGLDCLSGDEMADIQRLNRAYRDRHGFPFIIAVRHHNKRQIFEALRTRATASPEVERAAALHQIGLITRGRIDALVRQ